MKRPAKSHEDCVDLAIQARCDPASEDHRARQCREGGTEEAVPVLCHFVQCMAEDWATSDLDQSAPHLAVVTKLLRLRADPHAVGPAGDHSPTTVLDGHNAAYECIIEEVLSTLRSSRACGTPTRHFWATPALHRRGANRRGKDCVGAVASSIARFCRLSCAG